MKTLRVKVQDCCVDILDCPYPVTAGTRGLKAEFAFGSEWDSLQKLAMFRAGDTIISVPLSGFEVTIPWEVMEKPDLLLQVGVYGVAKDGSIATPTLWADVCKIRDGVDPEGDPGVDPTLPVWQDLLARVGALEESGTGGGGSGGSGADGKDGIDGASAYEIAVANGFEGSETEWLESLQGADGKDGSPGKDGFSIYQYNGTFAVDTVMPTAPDGFIEEPSTNPHPTLYWIDDIALPDGRVLQVGDFLIDAVGTLVVVTYMSFVGGTFLYSYVMTIKGLDGADGAPGADGYTPVRGTDYWTPDDIAEIKGYVDEAILGGAW